MTPPVALAICVAIILSAVVIVVVTSTGLHRTLFCTMAGLGVVIMVWSAYPPAKQLSYTIGFLFWVFISLLIYHFPQPMRKVATEDMPSPSDDLLDRFFKETLSHDH
jgi:hypothetical protein